MYNLQDIVLRIKDLRAFSDYSVADFAKKLSLPLQEYEEYESGKKDIPIGVLYSIASALMIDPSFLLFGKDATKEQATVVYNGKGASVKRYDGYSFISLNNDFRNSHLETMLVTIEQGVNPELVKHKGQEFNYVLEGSLRVIVGEREYYLHTGDSIYFDASLPHAQVAMEQSAKFLTVIEK